MCTIKKNNNVKATVLEVPAKAPVMKSKSNIVKSTRTGTGTLLTASTTNTTFQYTRSTPRSKTANVLKIVKKGRTIASLTGPEIKKLKAVILAD